MAHLKENEGVTLGFAKAASLVLVGYFTIKVMGIAAGNTWYLLPTGYGLWFLVELIGFVALPAFMYAVGVRNKKIKLIRWTAVWTVVGIALNRLNVSLIAFNWQLPAGRRYFPSWMEFFISLFIITVGIVVFKFIVTKMPILYEHPEYKNTH